MAKIAYRSCLLLFFISRSVVYSQSTASGTIDLYVSEQTGEYTVYDGSASKTTDKYESGDVTITTSGPLLYTVTPDTLSIGTEETKFWTGTLYPDTTSIPAAGTIETASISGDYTVEYSRPTGTGGASGITVISSHECYPDSANECWYHGATSGDHEIVSQTGTETRNFRIHSIKVEIPDTTRLCYVFPVNITATPTPDGGTYLWSTNSSNISLQNTTSETVTVTHVNNAAWGVETVWVKYTIEGVSYTDTGHVNATFPPTRYLFPRDASFDSGDRKLLALKIMSKYMTNCFEPTIWSLFTSDTATFTNGGAIMLSDPSIKTQLENWYHNKAQALIDAEDTAATYTNESNTWTATDASVLSEPLGWAMSTSTYKVSGTAKAECVSSNNKVKVTFDVTWTITDDVDCNSYKEIKANYGDVGWFWYPEIACDIVGDWIYDCDYSISFTHQEDVYVYFKP